MKKLVIAVFAVAIAAISQAATVKWLGQNAYEMGSTSTKASNYITYFICSSDYATSSVIADLTAGNLDFVSNYGKAEKALNSGAGTATISQTAGNSETWTGYLVIFNAATATDATHAFVSTVESATTGVSGQAATIKFAALQGTQDSSNWTEIAPEPTSGMMLLLGMGVLALRRRRA